jgi:hypothetical protein
VELYQEIMLDALTNVDEKKADQQQGQGGNWSSGILTYLCHISAVEQEQEDGHRAKRSLGAISTLLYGMGWLAVNVSPQNDSQICLNSPRHATGLPALQPDPTDPGLHRPQPQLQNFPLLSAAHHPRGNPVHPEGQGHCLPGAQLGGRCVVSLSIFVNLLKIIFSDENWPKAWVTRARESAPQKCAGRNADVAAGAEPGPGRLQPQGRPIAGAGSHRGAEEIVAEPESEPRDGRHPQRAVAGDHG